MSQRNFRLQSLLIATVIAFALGIGGTYLVMNETAAKQSIAYQAPAHQDPGKDIPEVDPGKIDTDEDEVPDSTKYIMYYQIDLRRVEPQQGGREVRYGDFTLSAKTLTLPGKPKYAKVANTYLTDDDLKYGAEWTGLVWFERYDKFD